jgi:hypothetical protein
LPLRFAIFSLFGEKKISILESELQELFRSLVRPNKDTYNYFDNEEEIEFVEKRKHAIDILIQNQEADSKKKCQNTLTEILNKILVSKKLTEEREARGKVASDNFYYAYRVISTPTM